MIFVKPLTIGLWVVAGVMTFRFFTLFIPQNEPELKKSVGEKQAAVSLAEQVSLIKVAYREPPRPKPKPASHYLKGVTLQGILADKGSPGDSFAIFKLADGRKVVVRKGQTIPGGLKLHTVDADRVVLDRKGELLNLAMKRVPKAGRTKMKRVATPTGSAI